MRGPEQSRMRRADFRINRHRINQELQLRQKRENQLRGQKRRENYLAMIIT